LVGVDIVSKKETDLFKYPRLDLQFGGYMFNRDIQIFDTNGALKAIELITEQGEGGISVPESHYTVFAGLYHRQQSWKCYDVIKNPTSTKYPDGAAKEVG
jgi:Ferritin-like